MAEIIVRPALKSDVAWMRTVWQERWGADHVVVHGEVFHITDLLGLVALRDEIPTGLVTLNKLKDECEVVTLDALEPGKGIGSCLLAAAVRWAQEQGCIRIKLTTTNDNMHALRFYQKKGFCLHALHRGAVDAARKNKPEIPLVGINGIPIHDEIELDMPI